jgi:hypothetical protein
MQRAGEVIDFEMILNDDGNFKGACIMEYKTYLEAERAIRILNKSRLLTRQILVK